MIYKLGVALDHRAILGEGPVWDDRKNLLYWIDSIDNKVGLFDPRTGANKMYEVGQNIGTLILTERDDEVIVGLVDGLYSLNIATGKLAFKVNPEAGIKGNRLNDGKADMKGRIWIGSMCVADNGVEGFDTSFKCNLHRVDADFSSRVMDHEVRLSNGLAWTRDGRTLYYIDSPTRAVFKYDFDPEKGTLANKSVCVTIPKDMGVGDGMDIDVDGNLWIAHWTGWCVGKWDPRTSKLLGRIDIPVARVASCAFGGEKYDKLYIVTASINSEKDARPQPQAGNIFVASELGTKGLPFFRFKG